MLSKEYRLTSVPELFSSCILKILTLRFQEVLQPGAIAALRQGSSASRVADVSTLAAERAQQRQVCQDLRPPLQRDELPLRHALPREVHRQQQPLDGHLCVRQAPHRRVQLRTTPTQSSSHTRVHRVSLPLDPMPMN